LHEKRIQRAASSVRQWCSDSRPETVHVSTSNRDWTGSLGICRYRWGSVFNILLL